MMVKKSDENSRALALNQTVGENCSLARTTPRPVYDSVDDHYYTQEIILVKCCHLLCVNVMTTPYVNVLLWK